MDWSHSRDGLQVTLVMDPGSPGNEWGHPHSGLKSPPWWTRVAPSMDASGGNSAEPCAHPLSPQRMVDTAKKNFGGGNTAWEEKSLSKYEFRWVPHPCSGSPASALDTSPQMPSPTSMMDTQRVPSVQSPVSWPLHSLLLPQLSPYALSTRQTGWSFNGAHGTRVPLGKGSLASPTGGLAPSPSHPASGLPCHPDHCSLSLTLPVVATVLIPIWCVPHQSATVIPSWQQVRPQDVPVGWTLTAWACLLTLRC